MPYILPKDRELYNELIEVLADNIAHKNIADATQFCGDLNYTITKLIQEVYKKGNIKMRYADYNEMIGMLECCKLEFYRKQVSPYEEEKIKLNGEVK